MQHGGQSQHAHCQLFNVAYLCMKGMWWVVGCSVINTSDTSSVCWCGLHTPKTLHTHHIPPLHHVHIPTTAPHSPLRSASMTQGPPPQATPCAGPLSPAGGPKHPLVRVRGALPPLAQQSSHQAPLPPHSQRGPQLLTAPPQLLTASPQLPTGPRSSPPHLQAPFSQSSTQGNHEVQLQPLLLQLVLHDVSMPAQVLWLTMVWWLMSMVVLWVCGLQGH